MEYSNTPVKWKRLSYAAVYRENEEIDRGRYYLITDE